MQYKQLQYNKLSKMNKLTAIMRVIVLKSYTIFLNFIMQFATKVAKAQNNV